MWPATLRSHQMQNMAMTERTPRKTAASATISRAVSQSSGLRPTISSKTDGCARPAKAAANRVLQGWVAVGLLRVDRGIAVREKWNEPQPGAATRNALPPGR